MRPFAEFRREGVVRKHHPELSKARSLVAEAEMRYAFLRDLQRNVKVTDLNANYFSETAYDILLELLRARLAKDGYKATGVSAHEAEVSYLRELGFAEPDVLSLDELRYWRNGILYYGKRVDAAYAKRAMLFLGRIYPRLLKIAA